MACENCKNAKAIIIRSKDKLKVCKECFFELFENEIHTLVVETGMFKRNTRVGVGISGGKDSTVLAYVLNKLNNKYDYGIEIVLLCVDEGISGYRDKSIETVLENQKALNMKLEIVSYKDVFGFTMDEVVMKIGRVGNCTYCGVFRRQALEIAAKKLNVECIVTGHNADDMAETVLLNFFRGDFSRLKRCTLARTGSDTMSLPRCKPFKYTYQREIVFYAYFKKLAYFTTECTYAPGASRGDYRTLIKSLEKVDPKKIINIIKAAEMYNEDKSDSESVVKECKRCGHPTSSANQVCNACLMVEKLKNIKQP